MFTLSGLRRTSYTINLRCVRSLFDAFVNGVGSLQASIAAVASEPKESPSRYSSAGVATPNAAAATGGAAYGKSRSRMESGFVTAVVTGESSVQRPLPLNKSTVRASKRFPHHPSLDSVCF